MGPDVADPQAVNSQLGTAPPSFLRAVIKLYQPFRAWSFQGEASIILLQYRPELSLSTMAPEMPRSAALEATVHKKEKKHKKLDGEHTGSKKRRHTELSETEAPAHEKPSRAESDSMPKKEKKKKDRDRQPLPPEGWSPETGPSEANGQGHLEAQQPEAQQPEAPDASKPKHPEREDGNPQDDMRQVGESKKHKKDRKEKKEKKRRREDEVDNSYGDERSGQEMVAPEPAKSDADGVDHHREKKHKRDREHKHGSKTKSKSRHKHIDESLPTTNGHDVRKSLGPPITNSSPEKSKHKSNQKVYIPADCPASSSLHDNSLPYPFYRQEVYLYLPLYPVGFGSPTESLIAQHLGPYLGSYAPQLKGVLLGIDHANARVVDYPGQARKNAGEPTLLRSVDEYAVGYGWLSVTVDLFIPARGAWMEGKIMQQNEGALGLVCWHKFNASIQANRLPSGWKWIEIDDEEAQPPADHAWHSGEGDDRSDFSLTRQMHVTGYWVDAKGRRVQGRVRFRIRDFDVGVDGDFGYLSLQGTMLTAEEEHALSMREAREEEEQNKKSLGTRGGLFLSGAAAKLKVASDFSVTKFEKEITGQEDGEAKAQRYSYSRRGSDDDS